MARVIEEFEEFRARQQCEFIAVRPDKDTKAFFDRGGSVGGDYHVALFANGARSNMDRSHSEPPTDPTRRAELIRAFLAARLKIRERDFETIEKGIQKQAELNRQCPENCPPPREDAMRRLRLVSFLVKSSRTELEIFDAANPDVDPKRQKANAAYRAMESQNEREAGLDVMIGEASRLRSELFPSGNVASGELKEPAYY